MSDFVLKKNAVKNENPLLLIIMDGIGLYKGEKEGYSGNAFDKANAPTLKGLLADASTVTRLKAHGKAVGLPSDDDMGNSEVGHNAMGAGRVFEQGAALVNNAIQSRQLFQGQTWKKLIGSTEEPGLALNHKENGEFRAVHFIGLLSDGNVHSHIDHLLALISECAYQGVNKVFVHTILDGRDVGEVSAQAYIQQLEDHLASVNQKTGLNYRIASGGGRMKVTMDRYEADWDMVALGWKTHVKGEGDYFGAALEALESLRHKHKGVIDQDLPPFVIADNGQPVGPIVSDDIVIFFNFRGDRAIEISRAFTEADLQSFDRGDFIQVHYAGMMEYDGDLHLPPQFLVNPPAIDRTISEYLAKNGIGQYAISETQKYGHVTYFWNGNNSEKFHQQLEAWVQIPSDRISFDKAPRMKADQITDTLITAMQEGKHRFYRVNFPNGDMVGHTGILSAAIEAVEAVDQNVKRLLEKAKQLGFTVIITADHGNCDQMVEIDKKTGAVKRNQEGKLASKTSHTLSPVPFILTGQDSKHWVLHPDIVSGKQEPGLGNIAATLLAILGFQAPDFYLPPIFVPK